MIFPWCTSPYSENIHQYFKLKEQTRIKIKFQSPQANKRIVLVDWIRAVSEKLRLSKLTVHLAIYILDLLMDTHDIIDQRLGPLTLTCLLISTKYEDDADHSFIVNKLLSLLKPTFNDNVTVHTIVCIERFVLHSLHWKLGWPTAATFAEFYRLFAVVHGDRDLYHTPHAVLMSKVQSSLDIFLDRSLLCVDLVNARPSTIAGGCLLAARLINNVSPAWPDAIASLTGSTYESLSVLANFFLNNELLDSDSGYSTSPDARSVREALEYSAVSTP